MDCVTSQSTEQAFKEGDARRLRPARCGAWFACAIGSGVVVAWLAVQVGRVFAPMVLFPILVGCLLAALLILWLRMFDVAHRTTIISGSLVAALALAGAQHWFSYVEAQRHTRAHEGTLASAVAAFPDLASRLETGRDASFGEFVGRSAARGTTLAGRHWGAGAVYSLWIVDAMVPLVVVTLLVSRALPQPYCDRCGTWYRTTRRGRIEPAIAADFAIAAGIRPALAQQARYRLANCASGCGPTRLEVSWLTKGSCTARVWLDAAGRQRIMAILDAASTTELAAEHE